MSDTTIPPAEPENQQPSLDNAAFARMRLENASLKAEAAGLQSRLDALEADKKKAADAELSEIERLRQTVNELEPVKAKHDQYSTAFADMIVRELESVPENLRPGVERLASLVTDPAKKLQAVLDAKKLVGLQSAPTPAGTTTAAAPLMKGPPVNVLNGKELTWGEAFKTR